MTLFGEVLVQEEIITNEQLETALHTQKEEMGLALGDILCRDFSIPQETIETLFVNAVLLPFLKEWFPKTFKDKLEIKGVDFGLFITGFDISISSFSRTTSKQITFIKNPEGIFHNRRKDRTEEQINAVIDTMTIQTIRKQLLTFENIGIRVNLFSKTFTLNDGPGFISEARIRLMQAIKQKK